MAGDVKSGLTTLLEQARPQDAPPEEEAEQMNLLGLPEPAAGVRLPEQRGPGRPAGSRNRRTQEWAEYLLRRYRHPLETLAAIQAMPVAELVARLGCKPLEAVQEQRLAAIALAPYLAQKQAIAVDLTNHKAVSLTINLGDGAPAEEAAVTIVGIVENQIDSGGDDDAV